MLQYLPVCGVYDVFSEWQRRQAVAHRHEHRHRLCPSMYSGNTGV